MNEVKVEKKADVVDVVAAADAAYGKEAPLRGNRSLDTRDCDAPNDPVAPKYLSRDCRHFENVASPNADCCREEHCLKARVEEKVRVAQTS